MSLKRTLLASTSLILLAGAAPQAANAATFVAHIYGSYDAQCGSPIDCTFGTGQTAVQIFTGSTESSLGFGTGYDTPSLFIDNPTTHPFTGGTLTLTGYQGFENGVVSSISLPTIAAGTIEQIIWTGVVGTDQAKSDLFSFDYDDLSFANGNPVGNFDAFFSATWNGQSISSCFSPDNTQGCGNIAGGFVGWEGLDPTGTSETSYDAHSGSTPGPLANIVTGTTGRQIPVPEPGSLALLGAGLGALGLARRKHKSAKPQA